MVHAIEVTIVSQENEKQICWFEINCNFLLSLPTLQLETDEAKALQTSSGKTHWDCSCIILYIAQLFELTPQPSGLFHGHHKRHPYVEAATTLQYVEYGSELGIFRRPPILLFVFAQKVVWASCFSLLNLSSKMMRPHQKDP